MPIVQISMIQGRTPEKKEELIKKVTDAIETAERDVVKLFNKVLCGKELCGQAWETKETKGQFWKLGLTCLLTL